MNVVTTSTVTQVPVPRTGTGTPVQVVPGTVVDCTFVYNTSQSQPGSGY